MKWEMEAAGCYGKKYECSTHLFTDHSKFLWPSGWPTASISEIMVISLVSSFFRFYLLFFFYAFLYWCPPLEAQMKINLDSNGLMMTSLASKIIKIFSSTWRPTKFFSFLFLALHSRLCYSFSPYTWFSLFENFELRYYNRSFVSLSSQFDRSKFLSLLFLQTHFWDQIIYGFRSPLFANRVVLFVSYSNHYFKLFSECNIFVCFPFFISCFNCM